MFENREEEDFFWKLFCKDRSSEEALLGERACLRTGRRKTFFGSFFAKTALLKKPCWEKWSVYEQGGGRLFLEAFLQRPLF